MHQKTKTSNIVTYILARSDLPSLNPGKLAAQVHHAGVQMMSKYNKSPLVKEYINSGIKNDADHFNTTLVLSATFDDIHNAAKAMKNLNNVEYGMVIDPSYPFYVENDEIANLVRSSKYIHQVVPNGKVLMTRSELTCAWFLGDKNDDTFIDNFLRLPLHP